MLEQKFLIYLGQSMLLIFLLNGFYWVLWSLNKNGYNYFNEHFNMRMKRFVPKICQRFKNNFIKKCDSYVLKLDHHVSSYHKRYNLFSSARKISTIKGTSFRVITGPICLKKCSGFSW